MFPNRLAVAVLGLGCVTAAGAGGYLAVRHNVTPVATPVAAGLELAALPSQPVREPESGAMSAASSAASTTPFRQRSAPSASVESKRAAQPTAARRPRVQEPEPGLAARPALPDPGVTVQTSSPERQSPVDGTWTAASAATPPATTPAAGADVQPPGPRTEETPLDLPREPQPSKRFDELLVSADSVIGLQIESSLSSERSRVEDRVDARVVRDIRVGGTVAIPAGTRAVGTVVVVERGGRFKERARLGIRFHGLVLADGTDLPISTETIYRLGEGPGNGTAARIGGGAVVGAIIGGILGGGKGAAIGATTGAGAGTASVMSGERHTATFPAGAELTARILSPITITVEHD